MNSATLSEKKKGKYTAGQRFMASLSLWPSHNVLYAAFQSHKVQYVAAAAAAGRKVQRRGISCLNSTHGTDRPGKNSDPIYDDVTSFREFMTNNCSSTLLLNFFPERFTQRSSGYVT